MVWSSRRWRSCFCVPIVLHRIFSVKRYKKATCFPDQLVGSVCSNVLVKILFLNVVSSFENTNRIPGQEKSRRFPMRTRRSKNIGFLQQHLLKYASAVCSLPNKRSTIKRCSVTMWIAFEKKLHLAARLDPGLNILEYRMQKLFFDLRKHIERIVRIFKGPEKFSNFIATGYDRKDFVEDVSGMGIALTIAWKFS